MIAIIAILIALLVSAVQKTLLPFPGPTTLKRERPVFINLVTGKAMFEIDPDSILADLDSSVKKLPVATIREARKYREIVIPRLIKVLHKTAVEARAGNLPTGNTHFFALFLLTEFQAKDA